MNPSSFERTNNNKGPIKKSLKIKCLKRSETNSILYYVKSNAEKSKWK